MILKDRIRAIAESKLTDSSHFLVDVITSDTKGPKKILILLDGDNGVTIDDCVSLSRQVGHVLEEEPFEGVEEAYRLEVSSPGVDYPLSMLRQYEKNIGRQVKITRTDGEQLKGNLVSVSKNTLTLNKEVKKGKKIDHLEVQVPLSEVDKTIVQISFKN